MVCPSWEAMTTAILLGIDLYSRLRYSGVTAFQTFWETFFILSFDVCNPVFGQTYLFKLNNGLLTFWGKPCHSKWKRNSQKTVQKMKKNHEWKKKWLIKVKQNTQFLWFRISTSFFQIALISKQSKIEECRLHEVTGNFP